MTYPIDPRANPRHQQPRSLTVPPDRPGPSQPIGVAMADIPARLYGGNGITVVPDGLAYRIMMDIAPLAVAEGQRASQWVPVWIEGQPHDQIKRVPVDIIPADAPHNGQAWGRQDGEWVEIDDVEGAPGPPGTPGMPGPAGPSTWAAIGDIPPASPTVGQFWWASNAGTLYLYFQDANSSQWVDISGSSALANYVPLTGGTLTGFLTLHADPTSNLHAATKKYVDDANAAQNGTISGMLPLTGGTLTGALTGTSGTFSGELKCASTLRLTVDNSRYLHWDGSNYSLGGSGNVWTTGNFNPASYAPVGGVAGNWVVGSATLQTDGNIYMPWAGTYLSTYFANYLPLAGGTISGLMVFSSNTQIPGAPVTGSAANTFLSNGENNRVYRFNSSLAYKTAVEPLEPEYGDKILQLRPIFYRGNEKSADDPTWSWFGFSAENCDEVDFRFCSYTVAEEDKGEDWTSKPLIPESVHTTGILAALVNLVQRQEARIAALEAR